MARSGNCPTLTKGQDSEDIAEVGRVPVRFNIYDEEDDGKERLLSDLTKGHGSEENTTVGRVPVRLNADFEEEKDEETIGHVHIKEKVFVRVVPWGGTSICARRDIPLLDRDFFFSAREDNRIEDHARTHAEGPKSELLVMARNRLHVMCIFLNHCIYKKKS
jgi:hypothetical protein